MRNNSNSVQNGGVGLVGTLTTFFVGLKLTGYITWPWLWVLSPMWISFIAGIALIIILAIFSAVMEPPRRPRR